MNEFSLIDQYFKSIPSTRSEVVFGIGDDAASLQVPKGMNLLVSTDTLVSEVHFLPQWNAYDIASKAIRANVSDLVAMAALPCCFTLALTLPNNDEQWLASFAKGISDAAALYNMDLIGGDITHGPLAINVTVMGLAPTGQEVRRNGAQAGDIVFVSGALGAAALAVQFLDKKDLLQQHRNELMAKLMHPTPRIDLIELLRKYATSAIDISDGLSADLNHICRASNVGAYLTKDSLPIHPLVVTYLKNKSVDLAISGGDDYELCFTVSPSKVDAFLSELKDRGLGCYKIGQIEKAQGLRIQFSDGHCEDLVPQGYQHF